MNRNRAILGVICGLHAVAAWVEIRVIQLGGALILAALISAALAFALLRGGAREPALRGLVFAQAAAWMILFAVGTVQSRNDRLVAESLLDDARSFRVAHGRFPKNHNEFMESRSRPVLGCRPTVLDACPSYFSSHGEACIQYRGWLRIIYHPLCAAN